MSDINQQPKVPEGWRASQQPQSTNTPPDSAVDIVIVDDTQLQRLHARENIANYLRRLWERRHFIWAEAKSKSLSSGHGTYLGRAWVLFDPLFRIAVYALVFGLILKVSRGMDNFLGFLMIGVIFFGFFTDGITTGGNLIQRSRNLINSFNFPKVSLAVSLILRQFLDHIVPAAVAIVGAIAFQWEKGVSFSVVGILPIYFLTHLFAFGCICFAARASAFFPDITKILSLVNRALFFTSGIFFTIERFETHPLLTTLVELNPIYQFLMAARTCVMDGVLPSLSVWVYISTWSLAVAVIGFVYFWHAEERYVAVR
ncbi:ABC transporter permease [Corynebacterium ammoniagenes]|uniref:Transport permease protein n=1 Tax=Corynebacterium ammoniagenes DSM 20306 TaxID=649754 RepID=A0ABP2IA01_CORAM|nr:ABC transporter permease [Corynebacterium ammoniagenes]APT82179.1 ABC transporter permease [Corynebacterium ammoniagenes DSM 20306]AQS73274.1 ABC transporter permease [Corynebacterium ammoniagenes]EFG80260.1 ABC-2 type transporter [Corynebacterium ammoniagenes DSM 20306]